MASKVYSVVKDGKELSAFKLLPSAKKLADTEGAEVFCSGERVYQGTVTAAPVAITSTAATTKNTEDCAEEKEIITADPVIAQEPSQPEETEPEVETYRLTALMNIRKKPSLDAQILYTRAAGTLVRVLGIVNDWLHLIDDTYILYEGGKWAVKT